MDLVRNIYLMITSKKKRFNRYNWLFNGCWQLFTGYKVFNKYPVVSDKYPLVTTYWILFIILIK